ELPPDVLTCARKTSECGLSCKTQLGEVSGHAEAGDVVTERLERSDDLASLDRPRVCYLLYDVLLDFVEAGLLCTRHLALAALRSDAIEIKVLGDALNV